MSVQLTPKHALEREERTPPTIGEPYLLVTNIDMLLEPGRAWLQELWHKDIELHLRYIDRLSIAGPSRTGARLSDDRAIAIASGGSGLHTVGLPNPRSAMPALFMLPSIAAQLWQAVGRTRIVHCGVAGWPIPFGWIAAPFARLRGRLLVVVIESAPWRPVVGLPRTLRGTIRGAINEFAARTVARLAHVVFYTQEAYRESFPTGRRGRGIVIPASWIDDERVLSEEAMERLWAGKVRDVVRELRVGFFGRLTPAKGVAVLLRAMSILEASGRRVRLDIFGDGELRGECERAAGVRGSIEMVCHGTIAYDEKFFEAIRPLHAVVVPTLSDEQPRIVYDAYSQGVPVVASDTPGLHACAGADAAVFVPPGDAEALAAAIAGLAGDAEHLRDMGRSARRIAAVRTHWSMHQERCRVLLDVATSLKA